MSRSFPGFCGGTYVAQSPNIANEEAINILCEQSQTQSAKTPIALLLAPGKKLYLKLPEGSVPDAFEINGRMFVASSNLWEVGIPGSPVNRGSLGAAPAGPTQIVANETQLLVLNNGNLYVLTLATNVFAAVNMAQFNGPVGQIESADGYGLATIQNSHTFQQSNLEDFTTWGGLNIATISLFSDNIVSMSTANRELWISSGKKTVVYYNGGAGFPVWIPKPDAFIEDGSAATFGRTIADGTLYWLAADGRGDGIAKRITNGYSGERISTHAVEHAWRQYRTIADAKAWSYQENGHTFVIWRFPSSGEPDWVYDIATGLWHRRGRWNDKTGKYGGDAATCHCKFAGKHLVGDPFSGNIYELSSNFYDDNGGPLRWLRRAMMPWMDNKYVYYPEIEFDVEPGLGPEPPFVDAEGNPRDPQMMMRISRDGGKIWGNTFMLRCGKAGENNRRARKPMCGRARKGVLELSGTDPIPWRITDAYIPGVYAERD